MIEDGIYRARLLTVQPRQWVVEREDAPEKRRNAPRYSVVGYVLTPDGARRICTPRKVIRGHPAMAPSQVLLDWLLAEMAKVGRGDEQPSDSGADSGPATDNAGSGTQIADRVAE